MNLSFASLKNRVKSEVLKWVNRQYWTHELDYEKKKILICDNVRIASCRKEPQTISWIESFKGNEVAFDVGANIGAYSLVMSLYAKKVYAFEPALTNYRLLCKNIMVNTMRQALPSNCVPVNIALAEKTSEEQLNYINDHEGKSGHQIQGREVDCFGNIFKPMCTIPVMAMTVDDFIERFSVESPHHLKLDVDGIEFSILRGAKRALAHPNFRSLLVEVNEDEIDAIKMVEFLEQLGLIVSEKHHIVAGYKIFNYLFRKPA